MRKLLLLNLAALSPAEISDATPNLKALAAAGTLSPLREAFPSLTCPSHVTMLTGAAPTVHGIVGNGWYDRQHAKVFMWNRSAHHIEAQPLWEAAREQSPGFTCANLFWRFAADSSADLKVTERPVYWSSGRKTFDFYTAPPALHDRLTGALGAFPFMQFWGPFAGIKSTAWILHALAQVMREDDPDLLLGYAPYLDYEGQRHGPQSEQARAALTHMDTALAGLLAAARANGRDVAIVSDYGFIQVSRPVMPNRVLREAGYLAIEEAANGDRIEAGSSRAFAVCDNQVAHIYVASPGDIAPVRELLENVPGIKAVLGEAEKNNFGIAHRRSGELIAVAQADSWFAYPYWFEAARAPDFERCIAIFDKAGFDPCELFPPPGPFGKAKIALRVAQKLARQAVPFDVIDPDPANPKGARNIAAAPGAGAVLVTSWVRDTDAPVSMTALKSLLLERIFD
ncbi:MAG: alkaline phosphatase family protein [Gammaproteobacteria bacterium]|nr:alkaline phosphatase family protein [Gammaproteobacteria bacterium]